MAIELVAIRASISVGSLTVKTPYIQSFNVRKSRGVASTFDAVLKVDLSNASSATGNITIRAGEGSASTLIFTGIVKKMHITPCWDDPHYCFLNLSGTDLFYLLEDKKYSRRCRASLTSWATIDSLVRPGLRSSKFISQVETMLMTADLNTANDTAATSASYNVNQITNPVYPASADIPISVGFYTKISDN